MKLTEIVASLHNTLPRSFALRKALIRLHAVSLRLRVIDITPPASPPLPPMPSLASILTHYHRAFDIKKASLSPIHAATTFHH
jgi:hypothetical protein